MKNGSKIKTAAKIVAVTIAVLIALYCAAYLIMTIATGDSMPMPLGFGSAVVLTGSMEPVLSANDLIFITRAKSYSVGDVVVYSTGGTPIVHRIISLDENTGVVVTKGDANNTADDPIPIGKIKGKLLFSLPFIGVVPRFVRTVPGMIIVLTLLFVLLYLSLRSKAKDAEEREKIEKIKAEIERLIQEAGETNAENAEADRADKPEREACEPNQIPEESPEKNESADPSKE